MNTNKNILITGSSDGIGAKIAEVLATNNNVFITGRDKNKLKKLSEKINAKGYLNGDLLDYDFADKLYKSAKNELGHIDILINNAGIYIWSEIENTSVDQIEKSFKLNLEIPSFLSTLVVPDMKKNKYGRIINIGSISAIIGEKNASIYSASKAGLIGLTKSLALELADYNINVNQINPGWVKTNLTECIFINFFSFVIFFF